jgi:hypothetical protein
MTIDLTDSLVQRSKNQIACDMDGEVVILDLASGTYYGLDTVGARVWSLIEQPAALPDIHEAIMAEFDVDAQTCSRDVQAFLERMHSIGLVDVSPADAQ